MRKRNWKKNKLSFALKSYISQDRIIIISWIISYIMKSFLILSRLKWWFESYYIIQSIYNLIMQIELYIIIIIIIWWINLYIYNLSQIWEKKSTYSLYFEHYNIASFDRMTNNRLSNCLWEMRIKVWIQELIRMYKDKYKIWYKNIYKIRS